MPTLKFFFSNLTYKQCLFIFPERTTKLEMNYAKCGFTWGAVACDFLNKKQGML